LKKIGGITHENKQKNLAILFLLVAAFVLVVSCEYKAPVETPVMKSELGSAPATFVFTKGTTITKAELWIYVYEKPLDGINGRKVGVYKVLEDWGGCISWKDFFDLSAPQYDLSAVASFTPTAPGYIVRDITGLVQAWINGEENNGLLLRQIDPWNSLGGSSINWRELYMSTENPYGHPYLKIYLTSGGSVQEDALYDTEILETKPTETFCFLTDLGALGTGFNSDGTKEKISLLIWDFDLEEDGGGCSLTPGYWKTHSEKGPAPYDATWALLLPDGEDTPFFSSGKFYYEALWTAPKGNAYWILAHAYIAAKLNMLNGADFTAAQTAYDAAKLLFLAKTPAKVKKLKGAAKQEWTKLATILDNYNNGYIGPGHCD